MLHVLDESVDGIWIAGVRVVLPAPQRAQIAGVVDGLAQTKAPVGFGRRQRPDGKREVMQRDDRGDAPLAHFLEHVLVMRDRRLIEDTGLRFDASPLEADPEGVEAERPGVVEVALIDRGIPELICLSGLLNIDRLAGDLGVVVDAVVDVAVAEEEIVVVARRAEVLPGIARPRLQAVDAAFDLIGGSRGTPQEGRSCRSRGEARGSGRRDSRARVTGRGGRGNCDRESRNQRKNS